MVADGRRRNHVATGRRCLEKTQGLAHAVVAVHLAHRAITLGLECSGCRSLPASCSNNPWPRSSLTQQRCFTRLVKSTSSIEASNRSFKARDTVTPPHMLRSLQVSLMQFGHHLRDKTLRLLVGQAGLLAHHHREETLRLHVGEAGHLAHPHREETVHLAHRLAGSAGLASPAHEPHDDMHHGPSGGSHHRRPWNSLALGIWLCLPMGTWSLGPFRGRDRSKSS